MGSCSFIVFLLAVLSILTIIEAHQCPPPNKVPRVSPPCRDDYDCNKHGKMCCRDQANMKSCVYPAPYTKTYDNYKVKNNKQNLRG